MQQKPGHVSVRHFDLSAKHASSLNALTRLQRHYKKTPDILCVNVQLHFHLHDEQMNEMCNSFDYFTKNQYEKFLKSKHIMHASTFGNVV